MEFWLKLLEIALINIVLSGDNAVVVAMASRKLPDHQQQKAILWGTLGAVILRVILTFAAVWLLRIPFVQAIGAALLLYIAVSLLKQEDEEQEMKAGISLGAAIRTIVMADLVMSLDNVLAMAGAAHGDLLLIVLGLVATVPVIVLASSFLMRLMNRFKVIVLLGAALLGFTAGEMLLSDKAIGSSVQSLFPAAERVIPIVFALVVLVVGWMMNGIKDRHRDEEQQPHNAG